MILSFIIFITFYQANIFLNGVKIGDEIYQSNDGIFYVYTSNGIYKLDPATQNLKSISELGSESWGDVVYMRDQSEIKHYTFAADTSNDKVWVIDNNSDEIITKVSTGSKPLHIYGVTRFDEVWVHLDGDGSFDVFKMSQVKYRSSSAVKALAKDVRHITYLFKKKYYCLKLYCLIASSWKAFNRPKSSRYELWHQYT